MNARETMPPKTATVPRILVVSDLFLPGLKGGGPIRSLANLVEHLGSEFQFFVLTRDRDHLATEPYPGIDVDRWMERYGCRIQYVSPRRWATAGFLGLLRNLRYDVLYLPSFFARSTIKILTLKKLGLLPRSGVVVAPRGQFHHVALGKKTFRKRCYLALTRRLGYFKGLLIHATNPTEAEESRALTGAPVHLAPNLSASRTDQAEEQTAPVTKEPGRLKLVYLSRIHPVKNLDFALDCLTSLDGEVSYDLYGPVEDPDYWRRCQEQIERLPSNIRASYHGPVDPGEVEQVFARYHALFLPTQTENHGHVILESLGAGCPVVISDRTPWRGLAEKGLGWDLPLEDRNRFRQLLQSLVDMGSEDHRQMSRAAHEFAAQRRDDVRLVEQSRELFRKALDLVR